MPNREVQYVQLFNCEIDEPFKAVEQLYELFSSKFPKPEYSLYLFQKVTKLQPIMTEFGLSR
jgi:hypothetical protein